MQAAGKPQFPHLALNSGLGHHRPLMLASEMSQSKPMARNGLEGGSEHGRGVWPPIQWQIVFCLPIAFLFLARRRNAEPRTVSLLLPAPPAHTYEFWLTLILFYKILIFLVTNN